MATKPSKNYINLCNEIPDLEENILRDKIKVIPLPRNSKAPFIPNWNTRKYDLTESFRYKNKKGRKFTQNGLKYHTGNYGILIGYNNNSLGYSIGCIDIDGYTLNTKDKTHKARIKKETQKLIYEALKDLPNSLQVKTQSGGYHLYFWTKELDGMYNGDDFELPTKKKELYIITTARKRDLGEWEDEGWRFLITSDERSSIPCHIDSWNNITKYADVKDAFFIFDEQRAIGSGQWSKTFIKIAKSNHWLMLSATPGDTWIDYIPIFIANGFYKNRTSFYKEHVVLDYFNKK